jgi:hypothetical protein
MVPFSAHAEIKKSQFIRLSLIMVLRNPVVLFFAFTSSIATILFTLQSLHILPGSGFSDPNHRICVYFFILFPIVGIVAANKSYNSSTFLKHSLVYRFNDEGVNLSGGNDLVLQLGWSRIIKKRSLNGYLLLYTAPRTIMVIPIHQFTDIQLDYFQEKIPKGRILR